MELAGDPRATTDLGGWCLSDRGSLGCPWRFPSGSSLAPGAFLVVRLDQPPAGSAGFGLGKKGDAVTLSNAVDDVVASVAFGPQREGATFQHSFAQHIPAEFLSIADV